MIPTPSTTPTQAREPDSLWTEKNGRWIRPGAVVRLVKAAGNALGWRVTFDDGRCCCQDSNQAARDYADDFLAREAAALASAGKPGADAQPAQVEGARGPWDPSRQQLVPHKSVQELPDEIRIPLHEVQADIGYLFGRVAEAGTFAGMATGSVKRKLELVEAAIRESLAAPAPTPAPEAGDVALVDNYGRTERVAERSAGASRKAFDEALARREVARIALLRRLAATRAGGAGAIVPDQWQPIETAPKDGTRLLLGKQWKTDFEIDIGWFESSPADRCWYSLEGVDLYPTHWQALPAPPFPSDQSGQGSAQP